VNPRVLVTAAVMALFAAYARPAGALVNDPEPGAVSATTLKVPDGPGSVHGLNDAGVVEPFSAQITYSVPIDLPAGRAGFGPSLSLLYSGDLGNGPLGVGWTISSIAIRRSLRHGVPSYTDADELELVGLGTGGRLYRDGRPGAENVYWVEGQGSSMRVERLGVRWEVRDAGGIRYILGSTGASRQQEDARVSAWFVDTIVNPAGEIIRCSYLRDRGAVYLTDMVWGPGDAFRAALSYPAGVDRYDATVSYRTGFEVRTAKRLDRIDVFVFEPGVNPGYVRQRAYEFGYDESLSLSRLKSVVMRGRDRQGAPSPLTLPPLTFTYADPQPASITMPGNTAGWVLNERGTSFFDVDGDGMADLLRLEQGNHEYRKNLGGSFGPTRSLGGASDTDLESVQLMDLDGDARAELVRIVDDTWRAYTLRGEAWEPRGEWPGTRNVPFASRSSVIGDIDGDGRMDVLEGGTDSLLVHLNGAAGLGEVKRLPKISPGDVTVEPGNHDVQFVDYNGDGLLDAVWMTDAWMKVLLGRGDGTFVAYQRTFYPWGQAAINVSDLHLADLNRDGLVDLVRVTAANVLWFAGRADGTFSPIPRHLSRPEEATFDATIAITDANGNGSQDIVWSTPRGLWVLDIAGGTSAGMLAKIDNGLGEVRTVTYAASAQLAVEAELAGQTWDHKLPISVPVPIEMTADPGAGGALRTVHYGVRDGFWDGVERRFGGFLESRQGVAAATAADTLYEETRFEAGLESARVLRGRPWYVRRVNALGQVFTVSKTEWEALAVAGLPDHPFARRAAETVIHGYNYEGVTTPIETRTLFEHDGEGRVTAERYLGRLDRDDDQKVVTRQWASDSATWVRDKVCSESLFESDKNGVQGRLVSSTINGYGDNLGDAVATPGMACGVGRGWLRHVEGLLKKDEVVACGETVDRPVSLSRRSYDSFGNVVQVFENGVTRSIAFDARTLHPTSETVNPVGAKTLTWTAAWDEILGVPEQFTDPNGDVTHVDRDDLGRQSAVRMNQLPAHIRTTYDWSAPRPKTTTFAFDGKLSELAAAGVPPGNKWRETATVSNGAGEVLYNATRLAADRWIISNWIERDGRGHVTAAADPFYTLAGQLPTTRPATGLALQTLEQDSLGRLRRQVLPNGAQKTLAYRAFEQTLSSDELAPVRSLSDGLSRVVRTERTVSGVLEAVDGRYDAGGRLISMSLQGGQALYRFTHDTLGRLASAEDPDVGLRRMCYDDRGLLSRHQNGAGQTLAFFYDGAARLVARGPRATFAVTLTDYTPAEQAAGVLKDYVYHYDDPAPGGGTPGRLESRLASVDEPPATGTALWTVGFRYDLLGRQELLTRDFAGVKAWEQTELSPSGLLLRQEAGDGFKLQPAYDPAGRVIQLGDIWRAGQAMTADPFSGLDAAGRVLTESYGNGLVQTYGRDAVGLPSSIQVGKAGARTVYSVGVTRNLFGAPTAVVDGLTGGIDHTATYAYDGAARLWEATMGASDSTGWKFRYRYDGLQNMTARFQSGPRPEGIGIMSGYYRYGENGKGPRQLTSIVHKDCPGDLTTYDYDHAGRLTRDDDRKLIYDAYDHLTQVERPAGTALVSHAYGYDGLRTFTTGPTSGTQRWFTSAYTLRGTTRFHYVSLGDRLVARVSYADVTTVPPTAGWLARAFDRPLPPRSSALILAVLFAGFLVWSRSTMARRRPVRTAVALAGACALVIAPAGCVTDLELRRAGLEDASHRIYFHQGVSMGPTLLTDKDGLVNDERRFEPFGQAIDGDLHKDPVNALNKETNDETGWSYHGARWLAPQTARWSAPDALTKAPAPGFMAAPWSLHPYQYVNQNPALFFDPDGQRLRIIDAGPRGQTPAFSAEKNREMAMGYIAEVTGSDVNVDKEGYVTLGEQRLAGPEYSELREHMLAIINDRRTIGATGNITTFGAGWGFNRVDKVPAHGADDMAEWAAANRLAGWIAFTDTFHDVVYRNNPEYSWWNPFSFAPKYLSDQRSTPGDGFVHEVHHAYEFVQGLLKHEGAHARAKAAENTLRRAEGRLEGQRDEINDE
jgi:RHS repeat-associated protein